jgi:hypothetical protein
MYVGFVIGEEDDRMPSFDMIAAPLPGETVRFERTTREGVRTYDTYVVDRRVWDLRSIEGCTPWTGVWVHLKEAGK